jgi:hypothetical protein
MSELKIQSNLSKNEVITKFQELFGEGNYIGVEMNMKEGIVYLTKNPFISPLTGFRSLDILNPFNLQLVLKETSIFTEIQLIKQSKALGLTIGMMLLSLIWFFLLGMGVTGKLDSIIPIICGIGATAFVFYQFKKAIRFEKQVIDFLTASFK